MDNQLDDLIAEFDFQRFQSSIASHKKVFFSGLGDDENRLVLRDEYVSFVSSLASWKYFVTLTFAQPTGGDIALARFRSLVRYMNSKLFGKRYTRLVHHSYFSYILGVEYQRRDVIHFHVLIDKPIDMVQVHSLWQKMAGFVWIDKIVDLSHVVRYVTKYVLKGGELYMYRSSSDLQPKNKPLWWV